MNGPITVPVHIGMCTLDVQHSILREVKSGVAVITLHVTGGRITDGRELTAEECEALEYEYGDAIEGALWEWHALSHQDEDEEPQPCND